MHFLCDNGRCIHNGLQCDGVDDCEDNSDENGEECGRYPFVPV